MCKLDCCRPVKGKNALQSQPLDKTVVFTKELKVTPESRRNQLAAVILRKTIMTRQRINHQRQCCCTNKKIFPQNIKVQLEIESS